jgi:NTE family protein
VRRSVSKLIVLKRTKPLSNKQKRVILTPIKKMDLNSKSIGLVLSGGGSKGIAHAGAIKF